MPWDNINADFERSEKKKRGDGALPFALLSSSAPTWPNSLAWPDHCPRHAADSRPAQAVGFPSTIRTFLPGPVKNVLAPPTSPGSPTTPRSRSKPPGKPGVAGEPAGCLSPTCLCVAPPCLRHALYVCLFACACPLRASGMRSECHTACFMHAPCVPHVHQVGTGLRALLGFCGSLLFDRVSPRDQGRGFRVLGSRRAGGSQGIAGLSEVPMG